VKALLRLPSVRLGLVIAALTATLVALRVFRGSSGEQPTTAPVGNIATPLALPPQAAAVAAAEPLTLDALGAPDDPLPAPLQVLTTGEPIQSDQGAETLARQILQAGPDLLPALIAGLQSSGIGIVGPDKAAVARPAEPWQGVVMQQWEVRLAAAMVLPKRSVTLTLPDLAAVLVAAIPELKGAPVERLIVTDLRALAESPQPTKRFYGRFIAALGRNAVSHSPYDLLGDVDPQSIQMDGLQASLVLRRLAIDILTLGNATGQSPAPARKTASFLGAFHEWLEPTVQAQDTRRVR
jgi:hypothetical protein